MVKMGCCERFTRREWFIMCALGSVNFASSLCASLQAPFYPQEAEKKGATATEYGLVFGVYELVSFISCPIFGKYMDKIGAKLLLNGGIITTGTSSTIFGLLGLVDSHVGFISLSFLIRIVESLGGAAAVTACFSITASVFPGSVATIFASLEIFYGLGFIFGPTIGGYLFELGGFMCPFMVIGVLLLLDGVFIFFALPNISDENDREKPQVQIFSVLKLTPVFLNMYSVTAAAISIGYYTATLEPHLRQFNLTPLSTGAMFVISGGTYALTSPLVGMLCDTRVCPKKVIIVGSLLVIVSFILVGPAPFMPFDTTLWVCCIGLIVHGLGYSCIVIPAFIDSIRSAVAAGLPDDITTYGIVSGLWASSFCLGAFIGPSVAGVLFDTVGFRNGTLFVIIVHCILFAAVSWFLCAQKPTPPKVDLESPTEEKESSIQLNDPKKERNPPTLIASECLYSKVPCENDSDYKRNGESEYLNP